MVVNKIKISKNQSDNRKRDTKRGKLSKTKKKKLELAILELNKKLAIPEDSKNKIEFRLEVHKEKLSNFQ